MPSPMRSFCCVLLQACTVVAQGRIETAGRILDAEGHAWAGATLTFVATTGIARPGISEVDVVTVNSDAAGRFRAMLLEHVDYDAWGAAAAGGTYRATPLMRGAFAGRPLRLQADGRARKQYTLPLHGLEDAERASLRYFVTIPELGWRLAVAPEAGVLRMPMLPGSSVLVCAWDERWRVRGGRMVHPELVPPPDAELRLARPVEFTLRPSDATGSAVGGARWVHGHPQFGVGALATPIPATGSFAPIASPAKQIWPTGEVEADGYGPTWFSENVAVSGKPGEAPPAKPLVLTPGCRARGRLLCDGRPVAGACVRAWRLPISRATHHAASHRLVWTSDDGTFVLPSLHRRASYVITLPHAPRRLLAAHGDHHVLSQVVLRHGRTPDADHTDLGAIDVAELQAFDVVVLEAQGEPVRTCRAMLLRRDLPPPLADEATSPTGRFRILVASPEELVLRCVSGMAIADVELRKAPGAAPIVVRLCKTARVSGIVRDKDGAPAAAALVRVELIGRFRAAFWRTVELETDAEGRFDWEAPVGATLDFMVGWRKPNGGSSASGARRVDVPDDGVADLELTVDARRSPTRVK